MLFLGTFLVLGERAKRASPNPHRESRVKKAVSHKPSVCQAFSARRPPSQLVVDAWGGPEGSTLQKLIVGSEGRGYDSPKSIVKVSE